MRFTVVGGDFEKKKKKQPGGNYDLFCRSQSFMGTTRVLAVSSVDGEQVRTGYRIQTSTSFVLPSLASPWHVNCLAA